MPGANTTCASARLPTRVRSGAKFCGADTPLIWWHAAQPLSVTSFLPWAMLSAFAGGRCLFEGAEMAGDRLRVLPVLFHLMWRRQLAADLAVPLGMGSVVHAGGTG